MDDGIHPFQFLEEMHYYMWNSISVKDGLQFPPTNSYGGKIAASVCFSTLLMITVQWSRNTHIPNSQEFMFDLHLKPVISSTVKIHCSRLKTGS